MIKILVFADVFAKEGRQAVATFLEKTKNQIKPDIIILNGENSAGGFGITKKIFNYYSEELNIDCVTMGNHWQSKAEIYKFYKSEDRIILPANSWNVSEITEGITILKLRKNPDVSFAVLNLIGKAFMYGENRCPFKTADDLLKRVPANVKIKILDFHAEATAEKQALAFYLKNQISLMYGSHTHVQTSDERILDSHMGYITDIGMSGSYDSVIGINKDSAIHWLKTGEKQNFEAAVGTPWVCALLATVDESNGRCISIERVQERMVSSETITS